VAEDVDELKDLNRPQNSGSRPEFVGMWDDIRPIENVIDLEKIATTQ
jgi:hypothetical protein